MEIKDLVGQSGTCFEQDRNESSVTAWLVEPGDVLRSHGRAFAGELQEPILMDELAKVGAQFEIANML